MAENNEINALDTYYGIANLEYDRIQAFFDQVDSKVGFLVAIVIGLPIASIGFASQLRAEDVGVPAIFLWAIGITAFLVAMWRLFEAIRVRDVKLGIPYAEFKENCKVYGNDAMREWVADILIESSEYNYKEGLRKATHLQGVRLPLILEVAFLLAGTIYVFVDKLY